MCFKKIHLYLNKLKHVKKIIWLVLIKLKKSRDSLEYHTQYETYKWWQEAHLDLFEC